MFYVVVFPRYEEVIWSNTKHFTMEKLLGVLLKSLTGSWAFNILTVEALLKSLTGIWAFNILTVGVLLKSLTGIWTFIILTVRVLL